MNTCCFAVLLCLCPWFHGFAAALSFSCLSWSWGGDAFCFGHVFFFFVASGCLLGNTARRRRFSFHYPVRNLSFLVRCFFYVTSVCFPGKTAKKRRFSLHYTVRARTVSRFGARVARSLIQNDCRKPVARGRFWTYQSTWANLPKEASVSWNLFSLKRSNLATIRSSIRASLLLRL